MTNYVPDEVLDRLRAVADRIEGESPLDADELREIAASMEYESLLVEHYPHDLTPAVIRRMRALERRLSIETLVPEKT